MLSVSLKLNILKSLDIYKNAKKGGSVVTYRRLQEILIIEISLSGKTLGKQASNASKNRSTSYLLTSLGMWVNSNLRSLQSDGIREVRLVPTVQSFMPRMLRQRVGSKFYIDHSVVTGQGAEIDSKLVTWSYGPNDNFLHLFLPKKSSDLKSSQFYIDKIKQTLKETKQ